MIETDTYRFFAYNQHCRHIFLACCHDNGYVAELDKYRYDTTAAPKTILVHAAQAAREYASLPFPVARFGSVFEVSLNPSIRMPVPIPFQLECCSHSYSLSCLHPAQLQAHASTQTAVED